MSDSESVFSLMSNDILHLPSPPIHNYTLAADEEAIFGRGIVLEQNRSTLHVEPVATQPVTFESTLDQQFKTIRDNINDDSSRKDFLAKSHQEGNRLVTLVNQIEPGQRIKLSTIILPAMTKQFRSIKIADEDVLKIPIPKKEFLDMVNSAMEVYFQRLIDTASTMDIVLGGEIDIVSTAAYVRSYAKSQSSSISKTEDRRQCLTTMLAALILERQVHSSFARFKHLISRCQIQADPLTQGAFIHLGAASNLEHRMQSFVTQDVIRSSPTCTYNFSVQQFRNLILSIFSRIPLTRATSKVYLLSSVKESVRQEIASAPLRVLSHAIGEFYLTQTEALMFMFSLERDITSFCPLCSRAVVIEDGRTEHSTCAYSQFVADLLCLRIGKGYMSTVPVVYLKPSIHEYTRRVLQKYHAQRSEPIVHRTSREQTVYKLANDMTAKTVSHTGVKSVNVANTSDLTRALAGSSSSLYNRAGSSYS